MKKNFRMSTRVIDEQANILKFGPKMPLMNGVSFKGFDKSESIIIFQKVNNLSWFWLICWSCSFLKLQKRMVVYTLQWSMYFWFYCFNYFFEILFIMNFRVSISIAWSFVNIPLVLIRVVDWLKKKIHYVNNI
jgi:hypothetical protein